MPTTSWVDADFGLRSIPDRTDETGTAVKDISGREDAFAQAVLDRGGTLTPADAFVPAKGSGDFDVDLGSGTADADHYVVDSTVTGQAPFVVRLEQTTATVTLDAADADDRWDQIYLVVRDTTLDGNTDGHTLSRLAYRKGDADTTPTKPGADAEWVHWELIASIYVTGGADSITNDDITDERAASSFLQKLFDESVRRTAASVFGTVLDSRYLEAAGDTATGNVTWTGGWPTVERTDGNGNTWAFRLDIGGAATDSPRLHVRKNGANYANLQWDEPNGRWELTNGPLSMGNSKVTDVADPSNAQDAATKSYVDTTTSNVQVFESSGTFTVPSNVERVLITQVGAGGGGGGATTATSGRWNGGAGGGAGATYHESVSVTPGEDITVTVGSGGAGGSGSNGGSNGGDSGTSETVSASGGSGGGGTSDSAVGEGGAGGSGGHATASKGSDGAPGALSGDAVPSGSGGSSSRGGGGRGRVDGVFDGGAGDHGGGGGGGTTKSTSSDASGGAGGDGLVIIEW